MRHLRLELLIQLHQQKTYLNTSYVESTNSLGQAARIFMLQVEISHIDHINKDAIVIQALEPGLPSYTTHNYWKLFDTSYKPDLDLSNREIKILSFFREGLSSQQIADHMGLSLETIKGYRKEMLHNTQRATMHELLADFILQENQQTLLLK